MLHSVILINEMKTALLLEQLRTNERLREQAAHMIAVRFGQRGHFSKDYDGVGLKASMDEFAQYCPNLVKIQCSRMNVQLEDFRNFPPFFRLLL
jgi:hypothetical protein